MSQTGAVRGHIRQGEHPLRSRAGEEGIMTEAIIVAIITGAMTFAGVLVANGKTQAVTKERLDALTREVQEHNNFARRMLVGD